MHYWAFGILLAMAGVFLAVRSGPGSSAQRTIGIACGVAGMALILYGLSGPVAGFLSHGL